jgi:SAM-dependent methyltransferase
LIYSPEDSRGFLSAELRASADGRDFELRRCLDCSFQWTSPQPAGETLAQLYAGTSGEYFEPLAESSPERRRLFRSVGTLLKRRGAGRGRLLDLGCGTGGALAAFRDQFELFGVEPSGFAAQQARAATEARVQVGDLAAAAYPTGFFDVVTAFDVVEHLADPLATLRELKRILRPGGVLVIETGDIGSLSARFAGGHWYYVLLPGHLCFFSRGTLAAALTKAGFADVESQRTHHGQLNLSYLAGYSRASARHMLLGIGGPRILALPIFRSRSPYYRVPYFFDHMLVSAEAR